MAVSLVKACGFEDEQVRNWVVAALEDLPAPDTSDATTLEISINSRDLDLAFWATTLLGRMEKAAASTVPTLAAAVTVHPEPLVRQRAAWALGKIGRAASQAIPQLEVASISKEARLARFATMALKSVRT